MVAIVRFVIIFIVLYALLTFLSGQRPVANTIYPALKSITTWVVEISLPSSFIESQDVVNEQTKKPEPDKMYLVYGNPVLITKAIEEAKLTHNQYAKIPSYSTQFFLFEMFIVPLIFVIALFIGSPIPNSRKWKGLGISLALLMVFILTKIIILTLFTISNSQIGIYELSDSMMNFLSRFISFLSLGLSIFIGFMLWLIFGFRYSTFTNVFESLFKSKSL